MKEPTDDILDQMVDIIVRAVDPERIILFGSRARGEARPDSDVDILIVDSRSFDETINQATLLGNLWNLLRHFRLAVDLLLFSPEEVQKWKDSRYHIIGTVLREGRVLYERP